MDKTMKKLLKILKNVFWGQENNLVGLKYLNKKEPPKESITPPIKKEYKLSELLKKNA